VSVCFFWLLLLTLCVFLVASFDLNIKLMLSAGRFVFFVASFDLNIKLILSAGRCFFFGCFV